MSIFTNREHATEILNSITKLRVNTGKLPTGVKPSWDSKEGYGFAAYFGEFGNKPKFIGFSKTKEEAHEKWRVRKVSYVNELAKSAFNDGLISLDEFNHYTERDFRS